MDDVVVINFNGRAMTSSLDISRAFNKRHADVLRSIQNSEQTKDFNERNFALIEYVDSRGRTQPMYHVTRDGWTVLVLGFTGKKAANIRELYIDQFNRMEAYIRDGLVPKDKWIQARLRGKLARLNFTDIIKNHLIPHAKRQGGKNPDKLYLVYTKMMNSLLIDTPSFPKPKGETIRNYLSPTDLGVLERCELRMGEQILSHVAENRPYKEIYQDLKKWCSDTASLIGKSQPQLPGKIAPALRIA